MIKSYLLFTTLTSTHKYATLISRFGATKNTQTGADKMNTELQQIFTENPHYKASYDEFLELHKNGYGKNSTPEELATFEEHYARDFLNGLKAPEDTSVLIKGERLTIRRASLADADFMESVELDEDNSPWVGHWPSGWRIAKFGDGHMLQTIIEKADGTRIGIMIFCDMKNCDGSIIVKVIKQYNTSPVGDYLN